MSFLLDTNIISELAKPCPSAGVLQFLETSDEDRLHLSVITLAELHRGIALLDDGQRQRSLAAWLSEALPERFAGRILDVTPPVAAAWGELMAKSRRAGTNLQAMDGLLAATASAHDMVLVTRNQRDFAKLGLKLLDPWTAE
ncbi:type II toxin-antitoxin system VapC family toxin [Bosea caraganae]|uniref:Ribonuclease VapC n=1 Tax=Bosea caraganae TaxID=2763117 RepID=A0A370L415_9HYPH|nr:type II toxin-antitoxin system VapC family toxin [Bosea caraganae]RDJ23620.1 type II toxin-antitoxin system VapC family toxin [Bosea caraganae]RDJ24436.1 type II toxin-antitoxin system VapC family toxin [Bosea caraganae]